MMNMQATANGQRLPADKQGRWRTWTLVALVAIAANVITLFNPGFFSHDEWQKYDHVQVKGAADFIAHYGRLQVGPDFGFPMRPIGFLQQGLSASFMADMPFVAHAIDVLMHVACTLLLLLALSRTPLRGRRAVWVALVFAVSPLAAFSTAWVGASFDRWYVLFGLVVMIGVIGATYGRLSLANIALIVAGTVGALLTKETSVVLPLAVLMVQLALWSKGGARLDLRRAFIVLTLVSLPIVAYLLFRLPALMASFEGKGGAYDPGQGDVWGNVRLYFAQPFLLRAVELVAAGFLPKWQWGIALAMHAVLVATLAWRRGILAALLYLAGYFLFLLPVLPVPVVGAHYLYASGVTFSIGLVMAFLPDAKASRGRGVLVSLMCFYLLIACVHSYAIQRRLRIDGICQITLLADIDRQIVSARGQGQSALWVVPDFGAPGYIAVRSTFGRWPYQAEHGGMAVGVGEAADALPEGTRLLTMKPDCRLVQP